MTLLRDISLTYASFFSLILFFILFESRYPRKKTLRLSLLIIGPVFAANIVLLFLLGPQKMSTLLLLTCSLPSLIFYWILAKHRDGRFFFTFCFADTLSLEIIYITNLLDFFLGNSYIFMFVSRLLLFPVLAWVMYKFVRPFYVDLQHKVKKGWGFFTVIALIFYVLLAVFSSVPTMITQRTEQIPAFVLLLVLMPAIYGHILTTLQHQQKNHEKDEQENILKLQVADMAARMEEYSAANEKFRMERHDFRHKLQTIAGLVEKEQYQHLRDLVLEYSDSVREAPIKPYCPQAIIDAVLHAYLQKAEQKKIAVSVQLAFPEPLPVAETELATVFANAIENAIHACEKLPEEKRQISIKSIVSPRFMLQIANSFDGAAEFDENGLPVSREDGHGFGTRSIAAFCRKHDAFYEFKATADTFSLRITF